MIKVLPCYAGLLSLVNSGFKLIVALVRILLHIHGLNAILRHSAVSGVTDLPPSSKMGSASCILKLDRLSTTYMNTFGLILSFLVSM